MKKIILFVSLLVSSNCFADELSNFDQIKTAVITGKTIHMVIDFLKCSALNKSIKSSIMVGVFTPNTIDVTDDHITTSLTHFTFDNPRFPGKAIYEFVKYTITDNNNISVTDQELDAVTYQPISNIFSFNCKISSGAKVYV